MRLRLLMLALGFIATGMLCACGTGAATRSAHSPVTSPAVTSTGPATPVTSVQRFYLSYAAARKTGQQLAEAVLRRHVAAWYLPVLEAPTTRGADPVECHLQGPVADWSFTQAGVLGGQAVITVGSQPRGAPQKLWIVVTAVAPTERITGITCGIGGMIRSSTAVTSTGATDNSVAASLAVGSFYGGYINLARWEKVSPQEEIARLTQRGPEAGNPYLQQVRYAITAQHLGYDPITCATGLPPLPPGTTWARMVAGNSVGVVVVSAQHTQFLVTAVLGAKGWAVGDIACPRPA